MLKIQKQQTPQCGVFLIFIVLIDILFIFWTAGFLKYMMNMLLLKWKEKSEWLKEQYRKLRTQYFWNEKKFVAVLFFWKSNPSQVYVSLKKKYAIDIWFDFLIFGQWEVWFEKEYYDLMDFQKKEYSNKDNVIELVERLNKDERCVWIICQLPLTEELAPYQKEICNSITPLKDMDWLWDKLQKWSFEWKINFLPATAQAVITLRDAYKLWDFTWKVISVVWQSDIVWYPISKYLELKWADVYKFDIRNTPEEIISQTKKSDIIISCTWALHLIDDRFVNEEKNQIIIDVGYWFLNWKSTGDVDFEKIKDKVYAISPVPGWVWPMTVASLFGNIFTIWWQKEKIEKLSK